MSDCGRSATAKRAVLESRLRYHHRCLREDATDPEMSPLERLALVRDRTKRIREIRQYLEDRASNRASVGGKPHKHPERQGWS